MQMLWESIRFEVIGLVVLVVGIHVIGTLFGSRGKKKGSDINPEGHLSSSFTPFDDDHFGRKRKRK